MQIATKGATKFFSEIYRYFGKEGGEIRINYLRRSEFTEKISHSLWCQSCHYVL